MLFWNFSEPKLMPKGKTLKQKSPHMHGVMKVESSVDSHAGFICQNPEFASSLVKTLHPANLPSVVSTTGGDGSLSSHARLACSGRHIPSLSRCSYELTPWAHTNQWVSQLWI